MSAQIGTATAAKKVPKTTPRRKKTPRSQDLRLASLRPRGLAGSPFHVGRLLALRELDIQQIIEFGVGLPSSFSGFVEVGDSANVWAFQ